MDVSIARRLVDPVFDGAKTQSNATESRQVDNQIMVVRTVVRKDTNSVIHADSPADSVRRNAKIEGSQPELEMNDRKIRYDPQGKKLTHASYDFRPHC